MSHDRHVYSMMSYKVSANQMEYMASALSGGFTGTLFSLVSRKKTHSYNLFIHVYIFSLIMAGKGMSLVLVNCLGGFSTGIVGMQSCTHFIQATSLLEFLSFQFSSVIIFLNNGENIKQLK